MSKDKAMAPAAASTEAISRLLAVIFLVGGVIAMGYLFLAQNAYSQDAPQTHVVEISGFEFQPADLTVREGDVIVWVNLDPVSHTSTADDGTWDSGLMAKDDQWEFIADTAGVFDYSCTPHPQMTGTITVEAN